MRPTLPMLLLLSGCPARKDSARESPPPVDSVESGLVDTVETGSGETGETVETGEQETGRTDSGGDTGDTSLNGPGVCGVDGIPSDGAPVGLVSLAEAEAVYSEPGLFAAGDQDGDGCSEFVFSTAGGDSDPGSAGSSLLFPGPMFGSIGASSTWATSTLHGSDGDSAMYPASGDIDGDGLADWVIGGFGIDGELGGAYVVYGPAYGAVDLWTEADAILVGQGDHAGDVENRVADLGGDGHEDILLVARSYEDDGRFTSGAYLEYGPTEGIVSLSGSDAIIEGNPDLDLWVISVSTGGDLDGDGFNDLLAGSDYSADGESGAAYVLPGPLSGVLVVSDADAILLGEAVYSHAGYDLSSGGDVDGDGYGDMLVGAPEYSNMSGRAYLIHGPVSGTHSLSEADAIVWAPGLSARVGRSVSLEQDMDGDGRADVAIGSPGADGAPNKGAVFLFYEPFSGTVDAFDEAEAVLYSEVDESGPSTGYRMAPAGDINGDGYDDLHIGTLPDYLVFGGPR